jgi:hypothetical protein
MKFAHAKHHQLSDNATNSTNSLTPQISTRSFMSLDIASFVKTAYELSDHEQK